LVAGISFRLKRKRRAFSADIQVVAWDNTEEPCLPVLGEEPYPEGDEALKNRVALLPSLVISPQILVIFG
jgi:hypothetical protein